MRYSEQETTTLAGKFNENDSVTIKIINMAGDILEDLDSNICTESDHIPGIFLWDMNNITNIPTGYDNYLYEMTNGTKVFFGKFIFGGYLDESALEPVVENHILSLENYDDNNLSHKVDLLENYDDTVINNKLDTIISGDYGLTTIEHDKLMALVNYDDKKLKSLAYAILGM